MSAGAQPANDNARRITFDLPGQRIAALEVGAPDAPTALLVPGYTGSKEDFGPILDPLAAAGFHVVAIDLPGQYESPGPAAESEYTPDRLASAVRGVAARLPSRPHLLGHSFGGLVARAAVIAQSTAFSSLVLLSSGPADLPGTRRVTMDDLEPVLASSGLPGLYAALQAAFEDDPGYAPPPADVADFLQRRFLGGTPQMMRGMADALRTEPDRVAELAAVGIRTMVAHGVDDDAWPPEQQKGMAGRLGCRYEVIADAAHSPAVENPDATAGILIDFWRAGPA